MDKVQWNKAAQDIERLMALGAELLKEQPHLGATAYIMAGDKLSAENASKMVEEGMKPTDALNFVGSYARFDWAIKHLPKTTLLKMLPELWSGSDPDDTNLEYLALWRKAWILNSQAAVCDGEALPKGKLTIYRGQIQNDPVGFAWTLSRTIALRFARTGGLRSRVANGAILRSVVSSKQVYGYLTGRSESEIIIDPAGLGRITISRPV